MSVLSLEDEFISVQLGADNPFRESVSYTPSGSTAKTIYAIVSRSGSSKISTKRSTERAGAAYDYEMLISCNATSGIQYVVPGKDKVSITAPEFAETNTFTVAGIVSKTAMCWHLGLRP